MIGPAYRRRWLEDVKARGHWFTVHDGPLPDGKQVGERQEVAWGTIVGDNLLPNSSVIRVWDLHKDDRINHFAVWDDAGHLVWHDPTKDEDIIAREGGGIEFTVGAIELILI